MRIAEANAKDEAKKNLVMQHGLIGEDILSLQGAHWVHAQIINAYARLIMERAVANGYSKFLCWPVDYFQTWMYKNRSDEEFRLDIPVRKYINKG